MADAFIGEIRPFAFGLTPNGWIPCDGRTLSIQQYTALFSLIGTYFGGDNKTTFSLPDLRGRTPVQCIPFLDLGKAGGAETVVLTAAQVGAHIHMVEASNEIGTSLSGAGEFLATDAPNASKAAAFNVYAPFNAATAVALLPTTIVAAGGGGGHENRQPSLALSYCICVSGYYPNRP